MPRLFAFLQTDVILKRVTGFVALTLLLVWGAAAHAQEQCSAVMQQAIALVSETCSATGRNEACHGYYRVEAKDRTGSNALQFNVGDIVSVLDVSALTTAPMNLEEGEWGVALLRLQANLPDLLPGENVTLLLLGDTRMQADDRSENARPMQIFQLETSILGVRCSEGPADGLLVQTPQDLQHIKLTVNGITIETAGTAFVQAQPGKMMTVSTLDGIVIVSLGDRRQILEAGTQVEIPMSDSLIPAGDISTPVAVQLSSVVGLPIALLPRAVESPVLEASQAEIVLGTPIATEPNGVPSQVASAAVPTSASVATPVSTPAPESEELAFDPRAALLTVSVVVLVLLLVLLLVVIIAIVVRGILRGIRQKRGLD